RSSILDLRSESYELSFGRAAWSRHNAAAGFLLHRCFRSLETDFAVSAIAKRLVYRRAAAAERKCGFASEVHRCSVRIDKFNAPFGRFHAIRSIGFAGDLYLGHFILQKYQHSVNQGKGCVRSQERSAATLTF